MTDRPTQQSINAPRPEDVGSFWTRMTARGGGPAKPSRFLIMINPPPFPQRGLLGFPADMNRLRDLTFQCEAAELPGRTLSTSDVQIAGPTFKLPYQSAFQDMTLTFLCTNDMYEKRIFDDWMNYINNRDNFTFSYRSEYATQIGIFQYDEGGDRGFYPSVTYGAQLVDAYPIAVNQMGLNWQEDGVHRLSVTFTYTYYQTIGSLSTPVPLPTYFGSNILDSLDPNNIINNVTNQAFGTAQSFINRTTNGAFTGIATFLGSFLS